MRDTDGAERRQTFPDARIAALAATRHGVFSRADAHRAGLTKRMIERRVATGRWERLHADVYRLAGAPGTWRGAMLAACLAWGDGALASHRAAAALWRLPGFEQPLIEVSVPRGRKRVAGPGLVHFPSRPDPRPGVVERIPVTSMRRTLIDLAGVVEAEMVEEALDDALRRRLLRRREMPALAADAAGLAGAARVRGFVAARTDAGVAGSVFETRLLRVMRDAGLPAPVVQYPIRDRGRLVAVVDFAYPARRVAIEADGYRWHGGKVAWERDLARRNRLTALGWLVHHVTWRELARPDTLAARLRALAGGA